MFNVADRRIRVMVWDAFDAAILNYTPMTIICYMGNGQIRPWKDYPSMVLRTDR